MVPHQRFGFATHQRRRTVAIPFCCSLYSLFLMAHDAESSVVSLIISATPYLSERLAIAYNNQWLMSSLPTLHLIMSSTDVCLPLHWVLPLLPASSDIGYIYYGGEHPFLKFDWFKTTRRDFLAIKFVPSLVIWSSYKDLPAIPQDDISYGCIHHADIVATFDMASIDLDDIRPYLLFRDCSILYLWTSSSYPPNTSRL